MEGSRSDREVAEKTIAAGSIGPESIPRTRFFPIDATNTECATGERASSPMDVDDENKTTPRKIAETPGERELAERREGELSQPRIVIVRMGEQREGPTTERQVRTTSHRMLQMLEKFKKEQEILDKRLAKPAVSGPKNRPMSVPPRSGEE